MPQVNLTLSSEGNFPLPLVGLYYQATTDDSPSSAGIGMIIGVDPMVYLLWGRDFTKNDNSKRKIGMDLGVGFSAGPSILLDYKLLYGTDVISLGLFTEYRYYPGTLDTCYDNCGYTNYLKSRWSFGLILIHSPNKRIKRYEEFPY